MTVILLLLCGGGYSFFMGQLLGWVIEQEPRLQVFSIFCYAVAVVFALCAVIELIRSIVRLARRGGHRYKRKRR